jgi:hypothetical protein
MTIDGIALAGPPAEQSEVEDAALSWCLDHERRPAQFDDGALQQV